MSSKKVSVNRLRRGDWIEFNGQPYNVRFVSRSGSGVVLLLSNLLTSVFPAFFPRDCKVALAGDKPANELALLMGGQDAQAKN